MKKEENSAFIYKAQNKVRFGNYSADFIISDFIIQLISLFQAGQNTVIQFVMQYHSWCHCVRKINLFYRILYILYIIYHYKKVLIQRL